MLGWPAHPAFPTILSPYPNATHPCGNPGGRLSSDQSELHRYIADTFSQSTAISGTMQARGGVRRKRAAEGGPTGRVCASLVPARQLTNSQHGGAR
jgi:hypothetical protein